MGRRRKIPAAPSVDAKEPLVATDHVKLLGYEFKNGSSRREVQLHMKLDFGLSNYLVQAVDINELMQAMNEYVDILLWLEKRENVGIQIMSKLKEGKRP